MPFQRGKQGRNSKNSKGSRGGSADSGNLSHVELFVIPYFPSVVSDNIFYMEKKSLFSIASRMKQASPVEDKYI